MSLQKKKSKNKKPKSDGVQNKETNATPDSKARISEEEKGSEKRAENPNSPGESVGEGVVKWFNEYFTLLRQNLEQKAIIREQNRPNWVMVGLTAVIICLGIISNAITWIQVSNSKDAMKIENRAYINAIPIYDTTGHSGLPVMVEMKNIGKSPAYHVRCYWQWDTTLSNYGRQIFETERLLSDTTNPKISDVIIGNTPMTVDGDCAIENPQPIGKEAVVFFIYGLVRYVDIFGEGHQTYFCSYINFRMSRRILTYYKYNSAN